MADNRRVTRLTFEIVATDVWDEEGVRTVADEFAAMYAGNLNIASACLVKIEDIEATGDEGEAEAGADGHLVCDECGHPMVVLEDGTTRHLLSPGGDETEYDHDADADHAARVREGVELLVNVVRYGDEDRNVENVEKIAGLVGKEPSSVDHFDASIDVLFHLATFAEASRLADRMNKLDCVNGATPYDPETGEG